MNRQLTTTSEDYEQTKPYFSDEQRQKFQNFIQELGTRQATQEDFLTLESIYSNNKYEKIYHHYYSDIGSVLSQQNIEQLDYISTNLQYIKTNYTKNRIDIKNQIEKLYDHSNIRILEQRLVSKINNETQISIDKLTEQSTDIEAKLEKNKFDYITILGIFASVMLAFVGGFTFSTSVLNNIKEVSIYRLTFIAGLIGFVFFNLVFLLLHFLMKMTNRKTPKAIPIFFNIVILSIMFSTFLIYSCKSNQKRVSSSSITIYEQIPQPDTNQ